jgi:ABC-type amino acid transport substrate-binding protein
MRNIFRYILLLYAALSTTATAHAQTKPSEQSCYKVAYAEDIEASEAFIHAFKALYKDAGLCAKMIPLPYKRADAALRAGTVDANALRTREYIDQHSKEIAYIDKPIISINAYLFGGEKISAISPRSDARPKEDITIGYLASNHWAQSITKTISNQDIPVRSHQQLIAMLQTGRIHGFIIDDLSLSFLTKNNQINLSGFKRKFIGSYPLYHVLDIRHENIRPALTEAVEKSETQSLFTKAYASWLGNNNNFYLKFSTTASKDRFPFTVGIDGDKDRTLLFEAISLILKDTAYTPKRFDIDATSRLDALKSGAIDFITFSPSWLPNEEPLKGTFFSEPIFNISDSVICQNDIAPKITNLEKLHAIKTGTISGYRYFDESQLKRIDYPSEAILLHALHNGDIECGIIGTLNFEAYNKQYTTSLTTAFIHSTGAYHLLIRDELKDIAEDINNSIISKRNSGELYALMRAYISSLANAH